MRSSVAVIALQVMAISFGTMTLSQPVAQSAVQLSDSAQMQTRSALGEINAIASALPDLAQPFFELSDQIGLRICNANGGAVSLPADLHEQPDSAAGLEVIGQLLAVTNLPMNFSVIETSVPHITAMVLEERDLAPRRVLLISPELLARAKEALGGKDWALIAAVAHEAGHHLAGHGLANGPGRDADEAEANAFAGLVLARLGAEFADVVAVAQGHGTEAWAGTPAQPTSDASATDKATTVTDEYIKLEAMAAGWGRGAMEEGRLQPAILPFAQATDHTRPTPKPEGGADAGLRAATRTAAAIAWMDELGQLAPQPPASGKANPRLPLPDPRALPVKFDHFVYDPLGLVNEKEIASLERDAMAYAAKPGVEIVTIVADSLHGYSARDYAQIMLRQLSVGQRDLGNGAVVVVAPQEGTSAVALAPGLTTALTGLDGLSELERRAAAFVEGLMQGADPRVPTVAMELTEASHAIMRRPEIANANWSLRYGSLGAALRAREQNWADRAKTNASYDPQKDPVLHQIVRLRARLSEADPMALVQTGGEVVQADILPGMPAPRPATNSPTSDEADPVSPGLIALYGPAQNIATAQGKGYILLSDPEAALPGPLVAGHDYEITARIVDNSGDHPILALISREDVTPLP